MLNKSIIKISVICLFTVSLLYPQNPRVPGNWQLVFNDEFNGNYLDATKWRVGQHWLGFNGISGNMPSQIAFRNGKLEITAEKKNILLYGEEYKYVSAEITTFQKFKQKYGYFEARIKYDAVRGIWPAFWTMPDRGDYGEDSLTYESFIKFNIAKYNSPVKFAKLNLKVLDIADPSDTSSVAVYPLLSNRWNENTITWKNKPQNNPMWLKLFTCTDDSGKVNEIIEEQYLTIDILDFLNNQIANNKKEIGFVIKDIYMQNGRIVFGSKEAQKANNTPHLIINGESIYPTDDAFVRGGNKFENTNYGKEKVLKIQDPHGNSCGIENGGMEMDIMESLGIWGSNKTQHAIHWDYYGEGHPHASSDIIAIPPTADGYHIYAMNWQPGMVEFYIDNKLSWVYKNPRVGNIASFILLSFQLGGWNGNEIVDDRKLPSKMYVDYIRVYGKN